MKYTEPQLFRLRQLATAYGHWYASYVDPETDAGTTHDELMARLFAREDADREPDAAPVPRQVYGPPTPDGRHLTGTGRVSWSVLADGAVLLSVWRPSPGQRAWRDARRVLTEGGLDAQALLGEEPCGEGEMVLSALVSMPARRAHRRFGPSDVSVHRHGEHAVRHVDAMRHALQALGRDVDNEALRSLLSGCTDLAEVAAEIRAVSDLDLVERCMWRLA